MTTQMKPGYKTTEFIGPMALAGSMMTASLATQDPHLSIVLAGGSILLAVVHAVTYTIYRTKQKAQ